jgi:hypothetical protein
MTPEEIDAISGIGPNDTSPDTTTGTDIPVTDLGMTPDEIDAISGIGPTDTSPDTITGTDIPDTDLRNELPDSEIDAILVNWSRFSWFS